MHASDAQMRFSLLGWGRFGVDGGSVLVESSLERSAVLESKPAVEVIPRLGGDLASLGRMRHRTRIASGLFRGEDEQ